MIYNKSQNNVFNTTERTNINNFKKIYNYEEEYIKEKEEEAQHLETIEEETRPVYLDFGIDFDIYDTTLSDILKNLPKTHFINKWINYGNSITDAYSEYHLGAGLFLLSLICNGKAEINVTPKKLKPNLWICLIGKSTVARKTTSIRIVEETLEEAGLSSLLHPNESSREQMIAEFAKNPQNGLILDEYGDILSTLTRSFQLGLAGLFCSMYDGKDHKKSLRKSSFSIKKPYFPMLCGTTDEKLGKYGSVEDYKGGFYPRHLFIWPVYKKDNKPRREFSKQDIDNFKEIVEDVKKISEIFNKYDVEFHLDQEAKEYKQQWDEEINKRVQKEEILGLDSFYRRLDEFVYKIASLFAIGEEDFLNVYNINNNKNKYNIYNIYNNENEKPKIIFNINIILIINTIDTIENIVIPSMKKVSLLINSSKADKLLLKLKEKGGRCRHNTLLNYSNMMFDEFNKCILTLKSGGKIRTEVVEVVGKNNAKRKVSYYCLEECENEE